MLKRIQEKFTTADINELNNDDYYMPTQDERENEGKSWEEVVKTRDLKNAFEGEYKCRLCPNKVINSEADLLEHLQSKSHKKALSKYYRENATQLKTNMRQIKGKVIRKYLFNMPKYQKLVRLGIHYKLMAQLQV